MRIFGSFHIEKKGHEGGARLKHGSFLIEKKVTRGGAGKNSVEIRAKFVFWAGRAQSFLNPKKLYFGLGLKVFKIRKYIFSTTTNN